MLHYAFLSTRDVLDSVLFHVLTWWLSLNICIAFCDSYLLAKCILKLFLVFTCSSSIACCHTSLLNHVPYVATCLNALIFHVSKCLRTYIYFLCLRALIFSLTNAPKTTHKIYWGSLLYLVLLFSSELFDLSFHSKPQNKLLLLKLHTSILPCGGFVSSTGACAIIWEPIKNLSIRWTLSCILNS